MKQQPLVTVLMPAYNAGNYIAEAIDSILDQTYADFEFLIINDGSTDNTLQVIQQYNDPRIRVINQRNKGLIDTLNEGIEIAQGSIIARMDADDICFPARLQKQLDFLQANPDHIMVGAEADVMDKDGAFLMKLEPIGHTNEEIAQRINIKCPFIHPAVTFYKEQVIKAGGYPKNALTFEDHLLWKELMAFGKVANLRSTLLKVRFNPESVTIDEKWRGQEFVDIRRRSIEQAFVSEADGKRLREIIASQNLHKYKLASYYATVAKKYLWNNTDSGKARQNLLMSIKNYPKNANTYVLFLFSFLPGAVRKKIYNLFKKH